MRITIEAQAYRKLLTQLEKPENRLIKQKFNALKQTEHLKGARVLWEPNHVLCEDLAAILEREQTFARKKESASFKAMTISIERLRKAAKIIRATDLTDAGVKAREGV